MPLTRRLLVLLAALAVAAAACAYESSGTTTTVVTVPGDDPVETSPADIVFDDQRTEGTSVVAESVTMPDDGWVVIRSDEGGSPGEVLGISPPLKKGVIGNVAIPFALPLEEAQVVHATVHIDIDQNGAFTYEPPDSFIDEIATFATGEPATASAQIDILPPLEGGDVVLEPQRIDGEAIEVAFALLPAPGFVALQLNQQGAPGDIVAVSELLQPGTVDGLVLVPDEPLRVTQRLWAVLYVDRDLDGIFDPVEGLDEVAVRDDGELATSRAVITVIRDNPVEIDVSDQEGEGSLVVVDSVSLPAGGFIEILSDVDGEPGEVLATSGLLQAGAQTGLEIELDEALTEDATLWIRVRIDFEEDGDVDDADPIGKDEDGDEVEVVIEYTVVAGDA
jgi:hypothetical protein